MKMPNLLTVTVIVAGCAVASQVALAYSAGDVFVRGGIAQTYAESDNGNLEVPGIGMAGLDRMPVNLMVNYYPMGGMDSPVQPYLGAGLNYTRFSEEELSGLDVRHGFGAIGQLGLDLAVARGMMLNGFVSYADLSPDVRLGGNDIGNARVDPMTVGGGVTYHF